LFGKIPAGTECFIANGSYLWLLILMPLCAVSWFGMNNIRDEQVSPNIGAPVGAFWRISSMLAIGLLTSLGALWLMLPTSANGLGTQVNQWLVLPAQVALTVIALKLVPGLADKLERQYQIFRNRHTWVMTLIYTMTFGSFIGFSAALPLSIKVVFGFKHVIDAHGVMTHTLANPCAPSALQYAWIGAFIGALIRPFGGWLADRFGGSRVTQCVSLIMVAGALGVAHYMKLAYNSPTPEVYFAPFFCLFLLLFSASGIGNGSTFRTVACVFSKEQAGPALGWASAVAAYGAFIIPMDFGAQIKAGTPEFALYGFAAFYVVCVVLNWFFYLRTAEFRNA
jgi:NNP family nitrate/nitrite transporter-like MFS transporter